MASAELVAGVRKALRLSANSFDDEITELIEAARVAMVISGVTPDVANSETNPLVSLAIKVYARANFGLDNPDSEKLQTSFDSIVTQLKESTDYGELLQGVGDE